MLELGAQRQTQPVLHQRDFILGKQTEQLNGALVGIERDCVAVVEFVGAKTVTGAPNNVLPFAQEETVLQVNVKRVAVLVQNRSIADSPVIINLQLQIRTFGEGVRPSSEDIAAADVQVGLVCLREGRIRCGQKVSLIQPAGVKIAL